MEIDVRGESCPVPMIRAMEALEQLADGEPLEVLVDHPPSLATIPFQAARRGYSVRVHQIDTGGWRLILQSAGQPIDPVKAVQEVVTQARTGG